MKLRIHSLVYLLFFTRIGVSAQTGTLVLSIDDAVRIAMEKNLSLIQQTIELGGKKRTSDRAWNSFLPDITAGAMASYPTSLTGDIPEAQKAWTQGVSLSASLNLSIASINNIQKAKIDYEAGLLTYQQAGQELELQIRKLFYQIILLEANMELEMQSLASAQARYEQTAAFSGIGQASRLDEMTARVDMENQRPNARNAETIYQNALDAFKSMLDIPLEQSIALSGDLEFSDSRLDSTTLQAAVLGSAEPFETVAIQKTIQSLKAQYNAARNGAYIPSLRVSWNSSPLYSTNSNTWNDSGSLSISLGMSIDSLLPWSAAKTQIDSINDSIQSAVIRLSETKRNSESRIIQYQRTIEQTLGTIEALNLNLELAQTAYNLYEEAWRNGAVDYQRLRDAGDSLLQAQNRIKQEQYNLVAAILDLEKELNIPFGSFLGRSL